MSKSIEQLFTVLRQECDLYKDYLDLAKEKKEAVIQGDIKELDHLTKLEQSMIVRMGKADQVRRAIIGNILLEKHVDQVENITELANLMEEPDKVQVLAYKDRLASLLEEIRLINQLNSELIHKALAYVEFNINLLTSNGPKGSAYGSKANEKDLSRRPNVFDAKI